MGNEDEMFLDTDYKAFTPGDKFNLIPIQGKFFHPFIHKVVEKLNDGLAPTIAIVGKQGLGKSFTAMKIAEILHEEVNVMNGNFTPETQLVYDVLPFLKRIRDITPPDEEGKPCPEREVFIFDEGGVNLSSVDWRSQENRGVQDALQTMRIKNCVYIFVLPEINRLDKQARQNLDFIISMKTIGGAIVTGIIYNHDRLNDRNKRFFIDFGWWNIDKPNKRIIEEYREKEIPAKNKFIDDRIDEIEKERKERDLDIADDLL